jgi:hypothetical protein
MRQLNRQQQIGMMSATYVFGLSGGLFLYPYVSNQSLIAFVLLDIGLMGMIFFVFRSVKSPHR